MAGYIRAEVSGKIAVGSCGCFAPLTLGTLLISASTPVSLTSCDIHGDQRRGPKDVPSSVKLLAIKSSDYTEVLVEVSTAANIAGVC